MMKMTTKELGYMATQYETIGEITRENVIDTYIDEELEVNIDMLGSYNIYLFENNYEPYCSMEDLDELLSDLKPMEIVQKTYFGDFRYSDDYIQFNGYANLDSFSECQIVNEMKEDRDFLKWYVEENELISEEDVEQAIESGNKYLAAGF